MKDFKRILFFLASALLINSSAWAFDWKELKGDHFIVYYVSDDHFAQEVSEKSEIYYQQIAADLGYPRYSNFWLWENRVKIFIYPSREEFNKIPNGAAWSHGMANYNKKEIYAFSGVENFSDNVLPHEITHLIFRDFVGTTDEIPLWMDEGIAQWEEPTKRALAKKVAHWLVTTNKAYSLQELTTLDIRSSTDEKQVANFYMQSVSVVDFLIRTYGGRSFTEFCRELRDGKKFEDALKNAYPNSVETITQLETEWVKYASRLG